MDLTNIRQETVLRDLTHDGYLIIRVPQQIANSLNGVFAAAYDFFREDEATKKRFIFQQDLGYRPFAGEYSVSPEFPDQLESYSVSPRLIVSPDRFTVNSVANLQKSMMDGFNLLEPIVEILTMVLASDLARGTEIDLKGKLHLWSRLQANYARPSEVAYEFINETHDDLDFLTATLCPAPGLEMKIGNDFVPIQTKSDEIAVFPGEIAWLLSGGIITPTYHRVRRYSQVNERLALLFFADLEPEACKPWKQTSLNAGVDIARRVRTNVLKFGLKGFQD